MESLLNPNGTPTTSTAAQAGADLIKDTDTDSFVTDVVEASTEVPVIVDFWAPWCGPCKQLSPVIEKLVRQAGGLVRLVKINVDENQNLAMQLRVQSIPAVFAFRNGQPVDGFVGALPESQIRTFIERLTGGAKPPKEIAIQEAMDEAAALLAEGDWQNASSIYNGILAEESAHPGAIAGIINCLRSAGEIAEAREVIESLSDEVKKDAIVAGAISAVDLAEQGSGIDDTAALEAKLAANPDHQARFDLAVALYGNGSTEAAIDALLELVRRNRTWDDEAARKQLLKIFEALGPTDPLTSASRRRLSSLLFS